MPKDLGKQDIDKAVAYADKIAFLKRMGELEKEIGLEVLTNILGSFGYEKLEHVPQETRAKIVSECESWKQLSAKPKADFTLE